MNLGDGEDIAEPREDADDDGSAGDLPQAKKHRQDFVGCPGLFVGHLGGELCRVLEGGDSKMAFVKRPSSG